MEQRSGRRRTGAPATSHSAATPETPAPPPLLEAPVPACSTVSPSGRQARAALPGPREPAPRFRRGTGSSRRAGSAAAPVPRVFSRGARGRCGAGGARRRRRPLPVRTQRGSGSEPGPASIHFRVCPCPGAGEGAAAYSVARLNIRASAPRVRVRCGAFLLSCPGAGEGAAAPAEQGGPAGESLPRFLSAIRHGRARAKMGRQVGFIPSNPRQALCAIVPRPPMFHPTVLYHIITSL